MTLVVVDASVAGKWFLAGSAEMFVDEAADLLDRYSRGELRIVVPDLFFAEIGNVFWKAVRRGRITKSLAQAAISDLKKRNFPTMPSATLLDIACDIAAEFHVSVYDSLYVALAVESRAQFVTADQRLVNTLSRQFPVKPLAAF